MPIYEFKCQNCGRVFDKLVRSASTQYEVECPECRSKDCKKAISLCCASGSRDSGAVASASSCASSG
jgi:putative FmdB family regulatory protein